MPTVTNLYNHTVNRFKEGLNAEADTYKLMLLSGATFTAAHTTLAQVVATGTEIWGNGWPQGGFTLTSVASTVASTNGSSWTFAEVVQAIAGASIGPFDGYVIYNDTDADDPPVCFVSMETALTVTAGNSVSIKPPSGGLITWAVT
jgi:hypothetical protein